MSVTLMREIVHYKNETFYIYLREHKNFYRVDVNKKSEPGSYSGSFMFGSGHTIVAKGKAILAYKKAVRQLKMKGTYGSKRVRFRR